MRDLKGKKYQISGDFLDFKTYTNYNVTNSRTTYGDDLKNE